MSDEYNALVLKIYDKTMNTLGDELSLVDSRIRFLICNRVIGLICAQYYGMVIDTITSAVSKKESELSGDDNEN